MMNFLASALSHTLRGENILLIVLGVCTILIFALMFFRRDKLNCADLVTGPDGKLSVEAIGQLCGLMVAVWTPVYMAVKEHLDPVVLGVCLGYLGSVHAFTKYMQMKNGGGQS